MRKKKTIDDIETVILIVNGERVEAFSVTDSGIYMGYSGAGFYKFLDRHPELKEKQHAKRKDDNSRKKYYLKRDLDEYMEAYPVGE